MRPVLAAILLAAASLPAAAQERPPMHPTRDVSVTYRAEAGAGAPGGEMRLSWLSAERKMRMDLPGGAGWSVTDLRTGEIFMVQEAARVVMQLPPDPSRPNLTQPGPDVRFTRGGTETLLGQRCTVWTVRGDQGEGEACITEDGVMLRSRGAGAGMAGTMTATQVSYGPQDPARFRPPQGYRTMPMPGLSAGSGPAGSGPGGARPPGR